MATRDRNMTYKLTLEGDKAALDAAETALSEVLFPPAGAVSLTKADAAAEDADSVWRLDAYFEDAPDAAALAQALDGAGVAPRALEMLPDIDWVKHALAGLGVVRAGRFVLYGAHDADKLPGEEGDIAIRIDANQAFGTGHHPTTAGCLALLDRLAGIAPERILDLGAGSAVLSIAAAKLWDRDVLATDIDEKSVEIARENALLNGAAARVDAVLADGFFGDAIAERAPFDFVFANILAGPLVAFAPAMASHVARNGRAMLAGFMADQEAEVLAAYEAAGFRRLNRLAHAVWPVLLLVRT